MMLTWAMVFLVRQKVQLPGIYFILAMAGDVAMVFAVIGAVK